MSDRPLAISRRGLGQILLAVPVASALAAEEKKAVEKPTPLAELIAGQEPGLSDEEQARLKKSITEGEKTLAVIRDFKLPPDVGPAFRFAPLKSRRS
jgi:hypothetical protein